MLCLNNTSEVSGVNDPGLRMIADSITNNVGLNARQLHLIPVEKWADCRFMGFRLQVDTIMDIRHHEDYADITDFFGKTLLLEHRIINLFVLTAPLGIVFSSKLVALTHVRQIQLIFTA